MTLVQKFLQEHGLETLQERYKIIAKPGMQYPNLYSLKYNMIESPMNDQIVRECRGIVVDAADNWRVVARPFDKFFNIGEEHAAQIDWDSAAVLEKLDGSLMILYYYAGDWRVASSGTPDASGSAHNSMLFASFADLFWHTFHIEKYDVPPTSLRDWTFMFELMTPHNRVVVPHKDFRLTLIGARNSVTGREFPVWAEDLSNLENRTLAEYIDTLRRVKPLEIKSFEEMMASVPTLDPMQQEGYVVVDRHFRRVKLKTPAYVAVAHMRDSFSLKTAIEIVRQGESAEVCNYFPEYQETLDRVSEEYDRLATALEEYYEKIKGIEDQKSFALEALKSPFSDCMFRLRKGQTDSVRAYLRDCNINRLEAFFKKALDKSEVSHLET